VCVCVCVCVCVRKREREKEKQTLKRERNENLLQKKWWELFFEELGNFVLRFMRINVSLNNSFGIQSLTWKLQISSILILFLFQFILF